MSRFRLLTVVALAFSMLAVTAAPALAQGIKGRPTTWVDGELFNGVVTPAEFDPANGNFDELYGGCAGEGGFKGGAPLISESKPGDQDYNGGRWHLNVIDPDLTDVQLALVCEKYEDADEVDFHREVNKHIAFGAGAHRCLGSHLARMELRVVLEEWHKRVPRYELAPGIELEYSQGLRQVENPELIW